MKNNPFHYSIATRIRNSFFIKYLNPNSNDKILEVGCGVGYFCELLNKYGAKVWGLDISSESIDYCKKNIDGEFYKIVNDRVANIKNMYEEQISILEQKIKYKKNCMRFECCE